MIDSTVLSTDHFNALVEAQNCFVTALIAVLPRAQRQALAHELTTAANRAGHFGHPLAPELLQAWAQRAKT
jgi:hypothetical protein